MSSRPSTKGRPTVLAFVPYYLPGYKSGGPVRSLANLVTRLGDEFHFVIVTRDRDSGDPKPYPGVVVGKENRIGLADVIYVDAPQMRPLAMASLVRKVHPDVLYLNSFFSRPFSMALIALRRLKLIPHLPTVLAPRGEFSPGALLLKRRRKRAFLQVYRALPFYRDLIWQASSPLELEDIQRCVGPVERDGSSRVVVAPVIASAAEPPAVVEGARRTKAAGHLRVAFLSRLAAKKNLLGALRILQAVRGSVELNIFGPVADAAYWQTCLEAIERLPANVRATYRGPVEAADVPGVLVQHDLFFLPTLGENYGHVIWEALAVGTPVLLSDQTPWRNLRAAQIGWDLPLDQPNAFRDVIEECIAADASRFGQWSAAAAEYARRYAASNEAVEANRRLFSGALGDTNRLNITPVESINAG